MENKIVSSLFIALNVSFKQIIYSCCVEDWASLAIKKNKTENGLSNSGNFSTVRTPLLSLEGAGGGVAWGGVGWIYMESIPEP